MLVYSCRQCKKMIINGYVNEFNEYFCSKICYEGYCDIHGYEVHKERLQKVNITLNY